MKKIKFISTCTALIIILMAFFAFASINTVNAATTQASVEYGEITDNGVEVSVKFSKDISGETFSSKWQKVNNNTIKANFPEGAYAYVKVESSNGDKEEGIVAVPVKLQEKEILDMTSKESDVTLSNLKSEDTSIATVNGLKVTAVKEGKTKITADIKFSSSDETKKYTWDLTVVPGSNTEDDNTAGSTMEGSNANSDGQTSENKLWADFSNATYALNIVDNENATVKINGINDIKGALVVYFSSKEETEEVLNNYKKYYNKSADFEWCLVDDTNTTSLSKKAYELWKENSDIYMHIVQIAEAKAEDSLSALDYENVKVVVSSVKINKPDVKVNDKTTADGKIPQTGLDNKVVFTIGVVMFIAAISFVGYKKYKDIK